MSTPRHDQPLLPQQTCDAQTHSPSSSAGRPSNKKIWLYVLILASAAAAAYLVPNQFRSVVSPAGRSTDSSAHAIAGPPWVYGHPDARFTVVVYADFACSFCRSYLPILKEWIRSHPETNWQWHHLPLSINDADSIRNARLAECAGESGGNAAFWDAVSWMLTHKHDDAADLPAFEKIHGMSPEIRACLDSKRPDELIHSHLLLASQEKISTTPTLKLVDHETSRTLVIRGPVEGDALLSAIDLLLSQEKIAGPD